MDLIETIDGFFTKIGLDAFTCMDNPSFQEPTIDFLTSMEYMFKNPKVSIVKEGIMNFKVKATAFYILIPEICEAYGFKNKSAMSFPKFKGIHFLWDVLAKGDFNSHKAKITKVRHPVICYALKLLAHAFFGRGETRDDDLGDDVNYGCILASSLEEYKNQVIKGKTKSIYIGGTLTTLFVKAGVDLSPFKALPKREYIDSENLVQACSLKCNNDANQFIYLYMDREDNKLEYILPSREITTLENHEEIEFLLSEEEYQVPNEEKPIEIEEDSPPPPPQRDDPYRLKKYDLPELKFVPNTKTEKLLQSVIKFQRKINKWQSYVIGNLLKKVKKLHPPDYVSSEFLAPPNY
ncbi:unnamed protein product [Arabidopsis arenosa]|uniref:Arabidopsis retrotransposon Orf1 C-terminal domain-containing protein n=1 Tax=Arabidopsis arenosa TaxID=38785 RepID=A0A8S2A6R5_ARAAE|nr:unnamed protein product [Arabidopsis arenosa]